MIELVKGHRTQRLNFDQKHKDHLTTKVGIQTKQPGDNIVHCRRHPWLLGLIFCGAGNYLSFSRCQTPRPAKMLGGLLFHAQQEIVCHRSQLQLQAALQEADTRLKTLKAKV